MNKMEFRVRSHQMIKQIINQFMQENGVSATEMIDALNETIVELKSIMVAELLNSMDMDRMQATQASQQVEEEAAENGE